LRNDSLAWLCKTRHDLLCHVLHHGVPSHLRENRGRQIAHRPIDGIDQTDVLLGQSEVGHRQALLSFIGPDLVAAQWKQWRIYFTDIHPTGIGPQREPGVLSARAPMAGYPKVFNFEMDPHEESMLQISWVGSQALKARGRIQRDPQEISESTREQYHEVLNLSGGNFR
jgi:hypothetical protein